MPIGGWSRQAAIAGILSTGRYTQCPLLADKPSYKCWEVDQSRHDEILRWQWSPSWSSRSPRLVPTYSHLGGVFSGAVRSVAESLRGQVIAVVGDSLERQRFMSLSCMLYAAGFDMVRVNAESTRFPGLRLHIHYILSRYLVADANRSKSIDRKSVV